MIDNTIVDVKLAVEYTSSEELFKKIVLMFLENNKNLLVTIDEYFKTDFEMYHIAIHSIKGTSKYVGSLALYDICEKTLSDLNNKEYFEEFKNTFELVYETLKKI